MAAEAATTSVSSQEAEAAQIAHDQGEAAHEAKIAREAKEAEEAEEAKAATRAADAAKAAADAKSAREAKEAKELLEAEEEAEAYEAFKHRAHENAEGELEDGDDYEGDREGQKAKHGGGLVTELHSKHHSHLMGEHAEEHDNDDDDDGDREDDHGDAAAAKDHNGEDLLCAAWAKEGECIRNPQYMWSACQAACGAQKYIDIDSECTGWATHGECEKNPGFMLERCNASCVHVAKQGMRRPEHVAHRNPHLLGSNGHNGNGRDGDDDDGPSHRAATFVPVLLLVLCVLGAVVGGAMAFAPYLAEQQQAWEEWSTRTATRLSRKHPALGPYINGLSITKVATGLICSYYVNEAFTVLQTNPLFAALFPASASDGVWQTHVFWVDASNLLGGAAAVACGFGLRPMLCGCIMLGDTLVDSYMLLVRILMNFLYGHGLYINELMAKKFSLLGCVALMIAVTVNASEGQRPFSGLLLEGAAVSDRVSLALLFGRLLIAVLFLYVGLSEMHRLLFEPFTPYLPGDGHDVVWPKAVELVLAVPFILGVKTEMVSRLLAASLLLEAVDAWSWWRIPGDVHSFSHHRRAIHYREHFVTNVATAGGLLLLQKIGAGRYTVDELLKKSD